MTKEQVVAINNAVSALHANLKAVSDLAKSLSRRFQALEAEFAQLQAAQLDTAYRHQGVEDLLLRPGQGVDLLQQLADRQGEVGQA